jgi:hypothetical protein
MATGYFQVVLQVRALKSAEAQLLAPRILDGLNFAFVVVKDDGTEGIVRVEEPESELKKIAHSNDCKKLTPKQLTETQAGYPAPRLKYRYGRAKDPVSGHFDFATDAQGNRVVEAVQTVRAGFYMIDVPVIGQPARTSVRDKP